MVWDRTRVSNDCRGRSSVQSSAPRRHSHGTSLKSAIGSASERTSNAVAKTFLINVARRATSLRSVCIVEPGLISATLKAKGIEYDADLAAGVIASPRMIDGKPVTSYSIPKTGKANVGDRAHLDHSEGKHRHPDEWSASNIPCPLGTRRGLHVCTLDM